MVGVCGWRPQNIVPTYPVGHHSKLQLFHCLPGYLSEGSNTFPFCTTP